MTAWSDLGLPTPNSSDYIIESRLGLYRTPFPTFKPDQARQYHGRNRAFTLSVELDRTQLAVAETYLRATGFKSFEIELTVDGQKLEPVLVRLIEPYRVSPTGFRTWQMSLRVEDFSAFSSWQGQTQIIEDALLATLYESVAWPLPRAIPKGSTLSLVSGEVRYQPPGGSWTQWVTVPLIVEGGGTIQLRQVSSGNREETTRSQIKIGGVPWTLIIITADCAYTLVSAVSELYPTEFSESFTVSAMLSAADMIGAQIEQLETQVILTSGAITVTRAFVYEEQEDALETQVTLLRGDVYQTRTLVYTDPQEEALGTSVVLLSGSVTSLDMVYLSASVETLTVSATLTEATLS